eukprot:TRINITY_DN256_c0_g1_i2.p1 TRINITY_DN256_c0_g1~~TRINITY_DN256_c0_g1_i2.p1  ORF type:complete len:361 (+),score=68.07 TRINITY_DN256_c0_g1_i2:76-1158(+)
MRRARRHGLVVGYAAGRAAAHHHHNAGSDPYGIPRAGPAPVTRDHPRNTHVTVTTTSTSSGNHGTHLVADAMVVGAVGLGVSKLRKQKKAERQASSEDKKALRKERDRRRALKLWDRRLKSQIEQFGPGILVAVMWRTKYIPELNLKAFKSAASKFAFAGYYKEDRKYSAVWLDGIHQGLFHICVNLKQDLDLYYWKKSSPLVIVYNCLSPKPVIHQSPSRPPPIGPLAKHHQQQQQKAEIGDRKFSRFIFAHGRALISKQQHDSVWLTGTFMASLSQQNSQTYNLRWWHRYRSITSEIPGDWPYETPLLDGSKYSSGDEMFSHSSSCESSQSSAGEPERHPLRPPQYSDQPPPYSAVYP